MARQNETPGSPLWWLRRLKRELDGRRKRLEELDDYYSGNHPLPFVTKSHNAKMRDEFRELLEACRSNFMELVIDSVDERLQPDAFRLSAESNQDTDSKTWQRIWQANNLDSEAQTGFLEALIKRVSYLSVWKAANAGVDVTPTIAVEDPTQTIVGYADGANYRKRAAALKVWTDEWTGRQRANVWMPDGIYKFERTGRTESRVELPTGVDVSEWRPVESEPFLKSMVQGAVPVIPLRNRSRLLREGVSEIESVTDAQDRINGELFMRCLAGYFGAHRQRWAVGLRMHENEVTGEPEEPFDVAVDKLWHSEQSPDEVKFGEFSQTDLEPYIKAIEQDVLHIAVTTRTPRHYLIEQGQSPSGDAIRSAESGLVKKVRRKMRSFGEGLEEAMRLARRFDGESELPPDSEIVWKDPEVRSEAELTDSVIKQYRAGLIPWETAMAKLGYGATEIRRMDGQRQQDSLLRGLEDPEPSPATESPDGVTVA